MFLIPVFKNKFVKLFMLPFSFVFLVPEPLMLILYHDQYVRSAVTALKLLPLYNDILQLEWYEPTKEGGGSAAADSSAGTLCVTPGTSPVGHSPPSKKFCSTKGQSPKKGKKHTGKKAKTLRPGEVDPANVLLQSKLAPPLMDVMAAVSNESSHILGKLPSNMPDFAKEFLPQSSQIFLGCSSIAEYFRLLEYLHMNGEYKPVQVQRRGACQYTSFWWGIDCPMEFTNTHLRRQLVMELIKHKEFFFPILHEHIAMNYGALRLSAQEYKAKCHDGSIMEEEREVYNDPGPFSFRTYLEHIWITNPGGTKLHLYCSVWCFKCGSRSLILLRYGPLRCDTVTTLKMLTSFFCSPAGSTICQQVGAVVLVYIPPVLVCILL